MSQKDITATAHKISRIFYHMCYRPEYLGINKRFSDRRREKNKGGRIELRIPGQIKWRFDGKRDTQIMVFQPRRKSGTPPRTAQRVDRSAAAGGVPSTSIDRNTVPANSQRIRGSKDMSGANGTSAGMLPQVSVTGRDDQMGEIQAFSQDGREEICH